MIHLLLNATAVLAQTAPSVVPQISPVVFPTPSDSPSLIPTLLSLISFARGFASMGLYAALATGLKLLVDLSKTSLMGNAFDKIPDKWKIVVIAGVGTLLIGFGVLAAGGSIGAALAAGLGSSAGSVFVHELLSDLLPKKPEPISPSAQPPQAS